MELINIINKISNDDEEDKQCNKPIFGGGHDIPYIPVIDIQAKNFKATETQFNFFGSRVNFGSKEVPATPEALIDHYYNEDFMLKTRQNAYAFERKCQDPKLCC